MVPVGLTLAGGALVAWTAAVGTAVAAAFGAGAEVAAGADLTCGAALGEVVEPVDEGSDVAEDPQATSKATSSNTIAFGKFFIARSLVADCNTFLPHYSYV